ncbi:hypothetical protein [Tissierella praeacuta]|uniref:hypothetical protein n=1 Tax=Tissierella praeacuta TaxID=43131 RepID=UPI001C0FA4B6|nr:hypothetical protein [Tissierella praeacuta]MBU5255774.1 hypothetical protein [Tissierella praeacuta]
MQFHSSLQYNGMSIVKDIDSNSTSSFGIIGGADALSIFLMIRNKKTWLMGKIGYRYILYYLSLV